MKPREELENVQEIMYRMYQATQFQVSKKERLEVVRKLIREAMGEDWSPPAT